MLSPQHLRDLCAGITSKIVINTFINLSKCPKCKCFTFKMYSLSLYLFFSLSAVSLPFLSAFPALLALSLLHNTHIVLVFTKKITDCRRIDGRQTSLPVPTQFRSSVLQNQQSFLVVFVFLYLHCSCCLSKSGLRHRHL